MARTGVSEGSGVHIQWKGNGRFRRFYKSWPRVSHCIIDSGVQIMASYMKTDGVVSPGSGMAYSHVQHCMEQ